MSRAKRQSLKDQIRDEVRRREEMSKTQLEIDWTMQAIDFLRNYTGEHPVLRSLARQASDLRWVPTERQVLQVHRIAHRERIEVRNTEDSLGRRLRRMEDADLPDSLADPDWL